MEQSRVLAGLNNNTLLNKGCYHMELLAIIILANIAVLFSLIKLNEIDHKNNKKK